AFAGSATLGTTSASAPWLASRAATSDVTGMVWTKPLSAAYAVAVPPNATFANTFVNVTPLSSPTSTAGVPGDAWMNPRLVLPAVTVVSSANTARWSAGFVAAAPLGSSTPSAATVAFWSAWIARFLASGTAPIAQLDAVAWTIRASYVPTGRSTYAVTCG